MAGGDGNATIRLGWEMTGDWFAWSGVNDPAALRRRVPPGGHRDAAVAGQHFTFDFNIAMGHANPAPDVPR